MSKIITYFSACLLSIYNGNNIPKDKKLSENHILSALGTIFVYAKDWQGGRAERYNNVANKKKENL